MPVPYQTTPLSAGVFAMGQDEDRPVPVDLTKQLAADEPPTLPACRLWLLAADGRDVEAEFATGLIGAPTVAGKTVAQRVAGLTKGRAFRLVVTHGAAGNRRSAEVVIPVEI